MNCIRIGRRALATLVIASLLLLSGTAFAGGEADEHGVPGAESSSPVILDLLFLRPVGIVSLITGTALYIAPVLPLTLLSRPSEIGKPAGPMIVRPARYVFGDPLGEH